MLGVLDRVAPAPAVSSVTSPYSPAGSAQISKNATIAYATVTFDAQASNLTKQDITRVMNFAEAAREPGLEVELGGQAIGNAEQPSLGITASAAVLGVAAALAVLSTMAAAVALLPATLGSCGRRVLRRKERRRLAEHGPELEGPAGWWPRGAATVQRHPLRLAAIALPVMLVLAVPFLPLRLGSSDQGNNPPSPASRHAYDLLAEGFGPGFNGPL